MPVDVEVKDVPGVTIVTWSGTSAGPLRGIRGDLVDAIESNKAKLGAAHGYEHHLAVDVQALRASDPAASPAPGLPAEIDVLWVVVDVDICPSTDDDNLARLASALVDLDARLRVEGDPEGVPFEPDADMLRQVELMTLITDHDPLDLCFAPDEFPDGYTTLTEHASVVEVAAVDVPVASLEDVVASKRAAGRPKDIVALPPLEARLRRR